MKDYQDLLFVLFLQIFIFFFIIS